MAIPISLSFFLPFFFSSRFGLSFWQASALGCAALPMGFFVQHAVALVWFAQAVVIGVAAGDGLVYPNPEAVEPLDAGAQLPSGGASGFKVLAVDGRGDLDG